MSASTLSRAITALLLALGAPACAEHALVAPLRYEQRPLAAEEAFRAEPPDATPVTPAAVLPWRRARLPNGLRVIHLERHGLPIVSVHLVLDRGRLDAGAPADAYSILSRLLSRGTAQWTRTELSDTYARLGAVHGGGLDPDGGTLWAKAGAAELDVVVSLLAENATRPRITLRELGDARAEWLQDVVSSQYSGGTVQSRNFASVMFGREHAYGFARPDATHANAIGVADVEALHARLFHPAHATLVVVGDATPEAVDASAARWLGAWSPSPPELPRVTAAPEALRGAGGIYYEARNTNETKAMVVARGPAKAGRELLALELLARTLGGHSSRLRGDVRVEQGAAYSFGAAVDRRRLASILVVGGALDPAKAVPAIRSMLAAIREARIQGVREPDLERARTTLLAEWRSRASTNDGLASMAIQTIEDGQPLDVIEAFPALLSAVTREDVQRVAQRYCGDEALHVLVIGRPGIGRALEPLGLRMIERRDQWGDLVKR